MKKYIATFTATVEIECENIAQAKWLANRISTVHTDNSGWSKARGKWNVWKKDQKVKVTRKEQE